ncbi:Carboxyphosphonoenolpyruvate mutase [Pyrenophora tritici-repentis]|uniref:Carboxyphosphonoenolpyruvate mutase n=3 Tax=Pyrenophora tritici-repentis TaxID=45151 RepID=A0A922SSL8_9PLEO|nr:Carboxyphosphonoenolpyruvate mutase [Pyrenophora tritici-repentis]KAI1671721.1 Carboxyphosphonoenolpyruvate mutase [Pyrenophora tritici-repentis]KAI1685564.1 Carboxyphosphonoenolpyruvate mutase [Pyrenophora tritici-repentis]
MGNDTSSPPPKTNGTSTNNPNMTAVQKLRAMLADSDKFITCPGVYDGFTARIALQEGVDCLYMTGAGTTMSRLGFADMGLATLTEMHQNATMLASLSPTTPLIADADTGYGGPLMVARTVTSYMRSGVAGLHIEDQPINKRCGHLQGKQLVDLDEYRTRIRAARLAREQAGGDIVIIARTDALQSQGYDEAAKRLKAAVEEGADVAFLEGVTSEEDARRICADLAPTPCLFNNVPAGVSPDFNVEQCKELGYKMAIFPLLACEVVYPAVRKAVRQMMQLGSVKSVEEDGKRYGPRELFEVCGLDELIDFDLKAGGLSYKNGA